MKNIAVFIVLFIFESNIHATDYTGNHFLVIAGYNHTVPFNIKTKDFSPEAELETIPNGFLIGLSFANDKSVFHYEVSVSYLSSQFSHNGFDHSAAFSGHYNYDYRLEYFKFSVLPVAEFGKRLTIAGSFYPQLGVLCKAYYSGYYSYSVIDGRHSGPIFHSGNAKNDFLPFTLDLNTLLRLKYKFRDGNGVFIESRYSRSISNINNRNEYRIGLKNFSLVTGISFNL